MQSNLNKKWVGAIHSFPSFFNVLEAIARVIRQEKEIKEVQIWIEVKLFIYILYVKGHKISSENVQK